MLIGTSDPRATHTNTRKLSHTLGAIGTMSQDNTVLDLDLLPDVPDTGGVFKQYGRLTLTTKPFAWRNGKTEEVSAADWKRLPQTVDNKNAKGVDMVFSVNIQEFRPQLAFTYERKVTVGGADWNKKLAPSIEAILGKGSMSKDTRNATLAGLNGKYVAVIDVPQEPRKNAAPDAKVYNTISFVKVYDSREACLHDASEGFAGTASAANGSAQNDASDPNVPADYSRADWLSMKPDVVDAVNAAINKATADTKGKPKPVVTKAIENAKSAAIELKATELAATPAQVEWLLSQ